MREAESYAQQISRLLYAKTDEKERFVRWLTDHLAGRSFEHALDVGPGPGHVTGPLAAVARHLTLVEKDPEYTDTLRAQFPAATVEPVAIQDWQSHGQFFDFILYSQGLYYHDVTRWLPLCRALYETLKPGGELVIVLNSDEGDWWRILERCDSLRPHWSFNYQRASLFAEQLRSLGPLVVHPFGCKLTFDSADQLAEFIGRQAMQILDDAVVQANQSTFDELAHVFIEQNHGPCIHLKSNIYVLTRNA